MTSSAPGMDFRYVLLLLFLVPVTIRCGREASDVRQKHSDDFFNLTILHVNDVHSRFEQINKYASNCSEEDSQAGKCFGGIARLKTALTQLRQQEPNVIFMAAGDFFVGTVWYTIHKWEPFAHFLPEFQLDVMSFGNHEFDDGVDNLAGFLRNVSGAFPVVGANIDATAEPKMKDLFVPSTVLTRGGRKIGVVGFLTPSTKLLSSPGLLNITDEVTAVRAEAQRLRAEGVKTIVALGHSGHLMDRIIAEEVAEVDVVVGGHSNTFLNNGEDPSGEVKAGSYPVVITQASGKRVPVVQAFAYTKYLGRLRLTLDAEGQVVSWGGNPVLLDASYTQDPDTLQALKPYHDRVLEAISRTVGRTLVYLDASRPTCRLEECNLGNFITDAIVHKYTQREITNGSGWSPTGMAIMNAGAIRASFDEQTASNGEMTIKDVLSILPYSDTVDLVGLRGSDIRLMFEHAVYDYEPNATDPRGHFLHVSGFRVVFDVTRPSGSRVVRLEARCTNCRVPEMLDVEEDEVYSLAMGTYLSKGGDGYEVIKLNRTWHEPTGYLMADILSEYIQQMSPIYPGIEGRFTFVNSTEDPF